MKASTVLPQVHSLNLEGDNPHNDFDFDGCTNSPDEYLGADLRPACCLHDYAYYRGGNAQSRNRADQRFYRNLRKCDLPRWPARLYYFAVRLH